MAQIAAISCIYSVYVRTSVLLSVIFDLKPSYTQQTKIVSESISDQTPGRTLLGAVTHATGAPPYFSQVWFHPLSAKFLNETEPIGT